VPDSHTFFTRVDRVLRRSLGVSETAQTDTTVAPAPPVDAEMPPAEEEDVPGIQLPDHMKDKVSARVVWSTAALLNAEQVEITMEEIDDDDNVVLPTHDEL
jgi:heat shock protein beta